jgi:hypothetical protein
MHGKTFAAGFVLHETVEKVVGVAIVLKHWVPKIGQTVFKCWAMGHARAKIC